MRWTRYADLVSAKKLPPKRRQALDLLLDGNSPAEVCEAVGVSRSTLWRWRKSPRWRAVWSEAQEARVREASDKLLAGADQAIEYLRAAVDPSNDAYKRVSPQGVRAAQLLLERGDIRRLEPRQEEQEEVDEERVMALLRRLPRRLLEAALG